MILLLDLCYEKNSLSKYEFVNPVADTLRKAGTRFEILHFTEIDEDELGKYDKIILCGTALKDNTYADRIDMFSWLMRYDGPVLGICAGMQVISAIYGGSIVPKPAIGLERNRDRNRYSSSGRTAPDRGLPPPQLRGYPARRILVSGRNNRGC